MSGFARKFSCVKACEPAFMRECLCVGRVGGVILLFFRVKEFGFISVAFVKPCTKASLLA